LGWHPWVVVEEAGEGVESADVVFAGGGEVAADVGEAFRLPSPTPRTATPDWYNPGTIIPTRATQTKPLTEIVGGHRPNAGHHRPRDQPAEHATGVCRSSLARNAAAAAASLAVSHAAVHNRMMVALRTIEPHRATVADAAGSECSARLTWHPDAERFTLTHWAGLICVAQIEVSPEDASKLLAVLAEGVAESMPRWLAADDPLPT